jgi:hypothetical protein
VVINVISKSTTQKKMVPKHRDLHTFPRSTQSCNKTGKHLEPPTTTSSTQENSDLAKLGPKKGYRTRDLDMMQWNQKHTCGEGEKEARKSRTDNEMALE